MANSPPEDSALVMIWRCGVADPIQFQTSRLEGEALLKLLEQTAPSGHFTMRSYQSVMAHGRQASMRINIGTAEAIAVDLAPRLSVASGMPRRFDA